MKSENDKKSTRSEESIGEIARKAFMSRMKCAEEALFFTV